MDRFIADLVRTVLRAGAPGSAAYMAALAQLQADHDNIRAKLSASDGKQVISVNAGESVSWSAPMSLQDQLVAYGEALDRLNGMQPVIRKTTARFFS